MKVIIATCASLIMLAAQSSPATASSTLLKCRAVDAVGLTDDGTLQPDASAHGAKFYWDEFIVDLVSGIIRIGSTAVEGIVTQTGSGVNDTVIVPRAMSGDQLVTASTDFLRVRRWDGMDEAVFLAFHCRASSVGPAPSFEPHRNRTDMSRCFRSVLAGTGRKALVFQASTIFVMMGSGVRVT